jgi:hypothetical protein
MQGKSNLLHYSFCKLLEKKNPARYEIKYLKNDDLYSIYVEDKQNNVCFKCGGHLIIRGYRYSCLDCGFNQKINDL